MNRQVEQSPDKYAGLQTAGWFQRFAGTSWGNYAEEIPSFKAFIHDATIQKFAQALAQVPRDYDELVKLLATPDPESRPALRAFEGRVHAGQTASPLAAVILPAVSSMVQKQSEFEATRAMLLAAIDARLRHGGPEALAQSHDPYNNGAPFEVREVEGGLVLQSKLTRNDKPVTLRCAW